MGEPDRFTTVNYPLRNIINYAYEPGPSSVEGLPTWTSTARYDISAKADRRITAAEKRAMVRSLLEDRFKLKLRIQTSEGQVYALTVGRTGKLGPNIRASSEECIKRAEEIARDGATQTPCPPFVVQPSNVRGSGQTMEGMARYLSLLMRTPVVDRTNLDGHYDYALYADTNLISPAAQIGDQPPPPSILAAIEEQAGLKLTRGRGPVKTFVVDSIEKPTPD
jgi:uncharacterized protein (TIGR03435 family)